MILLLGVPVLIGVAIASHLGVAIVPMAAWMGVATLIGLLAALVGPLATGGGKAWGDRYRSMASKLLQRFLFVRREGGGYDLVTASYDPEKRSLKTTLDGETKHFHDPMGLMGRLDNQLCGLADERWSVVTTPLHADLGKTAQKVRLNGDEQVSAEVIDEQTAEQTTIHGFRKIYGLPRMPRTVDPREWVGILPGSESPSDAETSKEQTKKSQAGFKSRVSIGQIVMFLTAYGTGIAVPWFLMNYVGGSGVTDTVTVGVVAFL